MINVGEDNQLLISSIDKILSNGEDIKSFSLYLSHLSQPMYLSIPVAMSLKLYVFPSLSVAISRNLYVSKVVVFSILQFHSFNCFLQWPWNMDSSLVETFFCCLGGRSSG